MKMNRRLRKLKQKTIDKIIMIALAIRYAIAKLEDWFIRNMDRNTWLMIAMGAAIIGGYYLNK